MFALSSVNYTTLSYLTPYQVFTMQLVSKKFYKRFVPIAERLFSLEGANNNFGAHSLITGCRKAFYVVGEKKGLNILYIERKVSSKGREEFDSSLPQ